MEVKRWVWKHFMKIRFESDDNLISNKILKLRMLTVTVRSIFKEDGKYFPQVVFRSMFE